MAAKALAGAVVVDGVLYLAGDMPPSDVAKRITNPKAWASADAKRAVAEDAETDDES